MIRLSPALLAVLLACSFSSGCSVSGEPTPTPLPVVVALSPTSYVTPTFAPTWTPHPPTPTNTRVVPIPPTYTPGPSPTPTRLPARARAIVIGIQDSHTLEVVMENQPLSQVFTVRLLGVEAPLLSDPWAGVAVEWLAQEVGRQVVVLESDEMERDAQGNLLRYMWKKGRMVNVTMVQLGLATVSYDGADLNYRSDLLAAQADARKEERGLWGPPPTITPTPITPTDTLTTTQVATATAIVTKSPTVSLSATQIPTSTLVPTTSP